MATDREEASIVVQTIYISDEFEQALTSAPPDEEAEYNDANPSSQGPSQQAASHQEQPQQQPRPHHHHDVDDDRPPRTMGEMYDRLVSGIVRPPRMHYHYPRDLGPTQLPLGPGLGTATRTDFHVTNARGHRLECSIWKPDALLKRADGASSSSEGWPCVIYLHGNSSSRIEACKTNVLKAVLVAAGCALVSFDFSG